MGQITIPHSSLGTFAVGAPSYADARMGNGETITVPIDTLVVGQSNPITDYFYVAEGFLSFNTTQLSGKTVTGATLHLTALSNNEMPLGTIVYVARYGGTSFVPGPQLPSPLAQAAVTTSGYITELIFTFTSLLDLVASPSLGFILYCSKLKNGIQPTNQYETIMSQPGFTATLVVEIDDPEPSPPPASGTSFIFSQACSNRFLKALGSEGGDAVTLYTGGINLALFTSTPTTAAPGTEPSAGYARVPLNSLSVSGATVIQNADIVFPAATAPWGTITHWGLFDGAGGEYIGFGPFGGAGLTVDTGTIVQIDAGNFSLTLNSGNDNLNALLAEMIFTPQYPVTTYVQDAGNVPRNFLLAFYAADGTELTHNGYQRKVISFTQPLSGSIAQNEELVYAVTQTGWPAIHTLKVLWMSGVRFEIHLTTPIVVQTGQRLQISAGALKIRMA